MLLNAMLDAISALLAYYVTKPTKMDQKWAYKISPYFPMNCIITNDLVKPL